MCKTKKNKILFIILSTLCMLILMSYGVSVKAEETKSDGFEVFGDEVGKVILDGHMIPHIQITNDGKKYYTYCRDYGGTYTSFKKDGLGITRTGFAKIDFSKEYTEADCKSFMGHKFMVYKDVGYIDMTSHQDVAYIFATANERSEMLDNNTQLAIWDSTFDVNTNASGTFDVPLTEEGEQYERYYDITHENNQDIFREKVQYSFDKQTESYASNYEKPIVTVDQTNKDYPYTVGGFSVIYPQGESTKVGIEDTYKETYNKLEKGLEYAKSIRSLAVRTVTQSQIANWADFKEKRNVAMDVFDKVKKESNGGSSITQQHYDSMKMALNNLSDALNRLSKTSGEKFDTIVKAEYESGTGSDIFSYISMVEVLEYSDVECKNLVQSLANDNDESTPDQIRIISGQGLITNSVLKSTNGADDKINANLPKSGQRFYIQFKPHDGVKGIKVRIYINYLESCGAKVVSFEGGTAVIKCDFKPGTGGSDDPKDGEKEPQKCKPTMEVTEGVDQELGGVVFGNEESDPKDEPGRVVHFPGDKGKFIVKGAVGYIQGTQASAWKNWRSMYLDESFEDGIPLTMDLEGDVFIDQDEGKVNEGNNKFDNAETEGVAGAEVWLYRHSDNALIGITQTDKNGHYAFKELDPLQKYYVKFVYNGMLYTNVEKNISETYNSDAWNVTSKAQEADRDSFNDLFAEIGSYPANYKIKTKVFSDIGDYNKVYLQEDIVNIFKRITDKIVENNGDLVKAAQEVAQKEGNSEEAKRKVQFAVDCRIEAFTDREKTSVNDYEGKTKATYIYPIYDQFKLSEGSTARLGDVAYKPIYEGQRHINLGIKARQVADLALYKDVLNAEVTINGKTETYKFDSRKSSKFQIGISQGDYLQGMRKNYTEEETTWAREETQINREMETDTYEQYTRAEEYYNGESEGNYEGRQNYQITDNWDLNEQEKLKVYVTYKIGIKNQSAIKSGVTEIADYFDNNLTFYDAYLGKENGDRTGDVIVATNSKFDAQTQYKSANGAYQTIYVRPANGDVFAQLVDGEEQYVYVKFELRKDGEDAGTILSNALKDTDGASLSVLNIAEINGYKTFTDDGKSAGLVDYDSNPGNLDISGIDKLENIVDYALQNNLKYEDDTNRAPALIYRKYESRTIEGTVFEDSTGKGLEIDTNSTRTGDGKKADDETKIQGVQVELIEIKNGKMTVKATTTTNENGWYGFTGFIPGDYTIRYTYGHNDATALTKDTEDLQGQNAKSYNGQDYQSTTYSANIGTTGVEEIELETDGNLYDTYGKLNATKGEEEEVANASETQKIEKYKQTADGNINYWYNVDDGNASNAKDDEVRKQQVIAYSNGEYDRQITNHKAEVFNAYVNPQPEHIDAQTHTALIKELERRTFRYAYTPVLEIEVEKATKTKTGGTNKTQDYEHKIEGVDFGIVERPKSELVIDEDIARIKVTASDNSTVLFDTDDFKTENLQYVKGQQYKYMYKGTDINDYDKNELLSVIMDEELINGAKLEITYKMKITNNSEQDANTTTKANKILNYISNNLSFDASASENQDWELAKVSDIQTTNRSTLVNNADFLQEGNAVKDDSGNNLKLIDLSTQAVILQAKEGNPLITTALHPGESTGEATLKVEKVLSTESSADDLKYTNLNEIVEVENTVGRYDRGATPGNQNVQYHPQEHDSSGASQYADRTNDTRDPDIVKLANTGSNDAGYDQPAPQDATIIIIPPTGSKYIYYVIGVTSALVLAIGIFVIKKYVIKK